MAAPVEEEPYEYVFHDPQKRTRAKIDDSYEGLPPNFSLAANMAAGAFAGIAVRCAGYTKVRLWMTRSNDGSLGTHCHVSDRLDEGEGSIAGLVGKGANATDGRHGCKSSILHLQRYILA
jgi:hypothetical protein